MLRSETTGERVRRLREALGWSQVELGSATDIDHTAISRLEHDRVRPSHRTLRDVASALGVSVEYLRGGDA